MRSTYKYRTVSMSQSDYKEKLQLKSVGDQIKQFCLQNKITYKLFAEYANQYAKRYSGVRITAQDISNYTTGKCSPKIDKLTVLCNAMHVPLDVMCGYRSIKDFKFHRDLIWIIGEKAA